MRHPRPWQIALAIFCAALALRLPFVAHYLWAWDSVLYARAIAGFDVAQMRPHAPGYLFYVLAARAASWVVGDPNGGLVLVSALAGAATIAVAFLAGMRISRRVAVLGALVLGSSPMFWTYSEIAYPYTLLALLSGVFGTLLWQRRDQRRAVLWLSLLLGLAAGFRQDLLLILGPLWLWALARHGRRAALAGVALLGAGGLAWLVPTALQSEGFSAYLGTLRGQALGVSPWGPDGTTVLQNARRIGVGTAAQLSLALPLLPLGFHALARRHRDLALPFLLWTAPALALYLLVHIGEHGYTLSLAVPLALVAALGADALLQRPWRPAMRRAALAAIGIAVAVDLGAFALGPIPYSAAAIRARDARLASAVRTIRRDFAPADTVLVAREAYQQARHYLPEYHTIFVRRGDRGRALAVPAGTRRLVFFLGDLRARPRSAEQIADGPGHPGVRYVTVQPDASYKVTGDEIVARP